MEIQQVVKSFIRTELGQDVQNVTDDQSLLEAGIVDSLGVLSLVRFIEERYGISVTEEEMMPENFDSIAAIAAFVQRRQAGRH